MIELITFVSTAFFVVFLVTLIITIAFFKGAS